VASPTILGLGGRPMVGLATLGPPYERATVMREPT